MSTRDESGREEARELLADLESELREGIRGLEGHLMDRVGRVCEEHPTADAASLTRSVARDPDFRRLNCQLRWERSVYLKEDIPMVFVREHMRAGSKVKEHWRLVGFGHLRGLYFGGRPAHVIRVLGTLVDRDRG